jgi:hypothetical protein
MRVGEGEIKKADRGSGPMGVKVWTGVEWELDHSSSPIFCLEVPRGMFQTLQMDSYQV